MAIHLEVDNPKEVYGCSSYGEHFVTLVQILCGALCLLSINTVPLIRFTLYVLDMINMEISAGMQMHN